MGRLRNLVLEHSLHFVVCADVFFRVVGDDLPRKVNLIGDFTINEGDDKFSCRQILEEVFSSRGYILNGEGRHYLIDVERYFEMVERTKSPPPTEMERIRYEISF